jgi:hypothetical protein
MELSEPHHFTALAPAPTNVVARCGSLGLQLLHCQHCFSLFYGIYFKFDFTKFIKSLFFNVPF